MLCTRVRGSDCTGPVRAATYGHARGDGRGAVWVVLGATRCPERTSQVSRSVSCQQRVSSYWCVASTLLDMALERWAKCASEARKYGVGRSAGLLHRGTVCMAKGVQGDLLAAIATLIQDVDRFACILEALHNEAVRHRDYEKASMVLDGLRWAEGVRVHAANLQHTLGGALVASRPTVASTRPRRGRRAEVGERTPQEAYYVPILQVLDEMGGRGRVARVLERLEEIMGPQLTAVDRELVPCGKHIRWQNAAQWARLEMVEEGLLRSDSPHGIWEISDYGREYLRDHRNRLR